MLLKLNTGSGALQETFKNNDKRVGTLLQIVNLLNGNITIQGSVDGENFETCKFEDDSDMIFTAESDSFTAQLPSGFVYRAQGNDEVNTDVKIYIA